MKDLEWWHWLIIGIVVVGLVWYLSSYQKCPDGYVWTGSKCEWFELPPTNNFKTWTAYYPNMVTFEECKNSFIGSHQMNVIETYTCYQPTIYNNQYMCKCEFREY